MKDIRLCDDGDLITTIDLCEENNLGIEVQGFSNPYIENKDQLKIKYLEIISCSILGFKSWN